MKHGGAAFIRISAVLRLSNSQSRGPEYPPPGAKATKAPRMAAVMRGISLASGFDVELTGKLQRPTSLPHARWPAADAYRLWNPQPVLDRSGPCKRLAMCSKQGAMGRFDGDCESGARGRV